MTSNDTQGHHSCCYSTGLVPVSGLLLQHLYLAPFPRYYHFPVHVTACDLEKSFFLRIKFKYKLRVLSSLCGYCLHWYAYTRANP